MNNTIEILEKLPEVITISGNAETRSVYIDGKKLNPAKSQKVWDHSPDDFYWGYGGGGPAQLALGILLEYLPKEQAVVYYQDFKFKVVAGWHVHKDFYVVVNIRKIFNEQILKQ